VEADKFTVVDGKLYLNYNGRVQSTWRKDTAGYIDQGRRLLGQLSRPADVNEHAG
jgi:hypothetical protein